ncbi:HAD family hydrolase [Tissierella creatinophila]|uniref:Phosphorylated carbohydrates phosphatase n=1 Tax=Tissierella creatinophila DSM 6911 TaxID=1123403 RepID=A0A1U7M7C2_TISCR|nr:HAD family phosphatase [Tissierella creatinophila]OLS03212.1 phosphorylated carbohydrates phosphatase [Tissierella creatinophila DSM 6911]
MKAAVFDFDGTLADSMEFWENLAKNYLESIEIKAEDDLNKALEKLTLDEGISYMKERYSIKKDNNTIKDEMDNLLLNYYKNKVQLKPYVIEFLDRLKTKETRIAIASVTDEKLIQSVLNRYDILDYFEFIQTCENTGLSKNDEMFFKVLYKNLNLEPGEIFLFEDSLFSMRVAKRVGLNIVGVEDSVAFKDLDKILEVSDFYIKDFKEAIDVLTI